MVEIFGDASYSIRDVFQLGASFGTEEPFERTIDAEQFNLSLGSSVSLSEDWQVEIVGLYSTQDSSGRRTETNSRDAVSIAASSFETWSLDGRFDGPLFQLPGGDIRLAVGGHYREESRSGPIGTTENSLDVDRDVYAAFGELYIPIVTRINRTSGIERLELKIAGRYEEYSDFGSSTDPKVGLLWSPIDGLNFRGTFGTSFRAPTFDETDIAFGRGVLFFLPDPASPTGQTLSLVAFGGNPDLGPESSTTWTAGLDFKPPSIPGLEISTTYFDIDTEGRIGEIIVFFDAFTNPRFAPLIDRSPDPDFVDLYSSFPLSANFAPGFEFSDAEAVVDSRRRNFAGLHTRGLDFNVAYAFDSEIGSFGLDVGGTYLFEQSRQLLPSDAPLDLVDTVFNPVDLRLRGSLSWNHHGFSSNLAVNYVDSYRDDRVDPTIQVDSWTTVDFYFAYNTGDRGSTLLRNTSFGFTALNVLDQDPPFIASATSNSINFDSNNANARGRTIAFQVTKQW